ncbi:MAG TPA: ABC transporter substrate-binding protein [Candidatus Merdiplasma excrementigallinarum]|uniref:ABC transporter substrate-binding protein n=1 Tax=Candidatus Merdiplasma excrementigallinarum TaxID=2840864 RepID=A0A9D1P0B3_9FIRM|nr:ABC transporter substrate-binding protein [Candidatus Merdiplasma excrementigallinarum]
MKKLMRAASAVLAATMALSVTAFAEEGGTFKIGGIGPLTGSTAIYGQAVMNAAQMAADEINAAGGINGYQIEFNPQDDESDAEKAVNAYNTLKDWGMQMLLGTVTSQPCIAVEGEAVNDNMFLLTPSGSAVECISAGDNAFRVCFSDPNQGTASARYIGEHELASKVAVIYDSSDAYSTGIYNNFAAEAANQGFEVVAAEAFTADSKTDFSVQLQKAKDSGAELVFLPIYYTEASLILTQAAGMGYEPQFFGCDGLDGLLAVDGFDTALAEGVMLLTPFAADAEDEATQTFVANYEEQFGDTPNQFAADAYDGMYIIKAAAEQAGITPDMDASAICDAMKVAMTEITVDGLTGSGITWTADGEPNKEPKAVMIENGAYTAM